MWTRKLFSVHINYETFKYYVKKKSELKRNWQNSCVGTFYFPLVMFICGCCVFLFEHLLAIHFNAITNKQPLPEAKRLPDRDSTGTELWCSSYVVTLCSKTSTTYCTEHFTCLRNTVWLKSKYCVIKWKKKVNKSKKRKDYYLILFISNPSKLVQLWVWQLRCYCEYLRKKICNKKIKKGFMRRCSMQCDSAADRSGHSQRSSVESHKTIPWEEKCSEWWQLKGNKPIIKSSKVAMRELCSCCIQNSRANKCH